MSNQGCNCRLSGNDCGGFKPPKKGQHLDTQMFPECEGKETDRNIVKKTVERRKKKKVKAESSFNLSKEKQICDFLVAEAKKKKKKYDPNPWAVCTKSVGRDKKDKYERCVMDVKKKQAIHIFNLSKNSKKQ